MPRFIANARMYAVAPEAEAHWRSLLGHVAAEAGLELDYQPYPAPQPLDRLWARRDLGAVFMCGYPIALGLADIVPIAAPIPRADWAGGRALYRSDLIVRADAPYGRIEDTFGARAGWTVEHSHSGFNAFRHHLLGFRSAERTSLYGEMTGNLITARAVLDAVREGRIDIGPLDSYWHLLVKRFRPDLVAGIRVLAWTETAPIPAFVASPELPAAEIEQLVSAFANAHRRAWFSEPAEALALAGFAPVNADSFATTLAWDRAANAAGYPFPA